jgi:hypothetical protein
VAARSPTRSERLLCGLHKPPSVLSLGGNGRQKRQKEADRLRGRRAQLRMHHFCQRPRFWLRTNPVPRRSNNANNHCRYHDPLRKQLIELPPLPLAETRLACLARHSLEPSPYHLLCLS